MRTVSIPPTTAPGRHRISVPARLAALGAVVAVTAPLAVACGSSDDSAAPGNPRDVIIGDDGSITYTTCGHEIHMDKHPETVISAGLGGINTLVAAGGAGKVIGRSYEYGEPPSSITKGKIENIDVLSDEGLTPEQVVSTNPDWLYGESFGTQGLSPEWMMDHDVAFMIPEYECYNYYPDKPYVEPTMDAIIDEIGRVATVLGTEEAARREIEDLTATIDEAKRIASTVPTQRVAVVYFFDESNDFFSYGAKGVPQEMLTALGHDNATDPDYFYHDGPLSPESFIQSDPDIVIVATGSSGVDFAGSVKRLKSIPGIADMRAFKENRIAEAPNAGFYASAESIPAMKTVAEAIAKYGVK